MRLFHGMTQAALLATVALQLLSIQAWAQAPVQSIARSGDAYGTPSGTTFSSFGSVVINGSGSAAFVGTMQGAGVTPDNDTGLWAGLPGSLTMAARENAAAPGTPGDVRFAQFQAPSLNNLGQLEFFARLRGDNVSTVTEYGTWAGLPGSIQLGYRAGTPLPGINPALQPSIGAFPVYSNGGQIAFAGIYDDPNVVGSQLGVWAGSPGVIAAVAVPGQTAPGLGAGVTFRSALLPTISPDGRIAFYASVQGPGINLDNDQGIWLRSGGVLNLVAREGNAAPDLPFIALGATFGEPAVNGAGAVAFTNTLSGPLINADNDRALFAGVSGSLRLIAREGFVASGESPGVVFDSFGSRPLLGGSGAVVAQVKLRGPGVTANNEDGIWANPTNVFRKVARAADPAPSTSANFKTIGAPTANYHGQAAFHATLDDPQSSTGIWAVDPFNQLVQVAGRGSTLRLGPGDDRIVSSLSLLVGSGGQDGRGSSFNAASQLAFSVAFEDGSSAAVISRVGGAARISDIAPLIGPAAANGYGKLTPVTAGDTVSVLGDAGYIRFADVAPAGSFAQILLDFSGTETSISAALAEIGSGSDAYGYEFSLLGNGEYQATLEFTSTGAASQFFYWNIMNIASVDLRRVHFVPEPTTFLLLGALTSGFVPRRSKARHLRRAVGRRASAAQDLRP